MNMHTACEKEVYVPGVFFILCSLWFFYPIITFPYLCVFWGGCCSKHGAELPQHPPPAHHVKLICSQSSVQLTSRAIHQWHVQRLVHRRRVFSPFLLPTWGSRLNCSQRSTKLPEHAITGGHSWLWPAPHADQKHKVMAWFSVMTVRTAHCFVYVNICGDSWCFAEFGNFSPKSSFTYGL